MTRLLLVRHGQDVDNSHRVLNGHRDTSLTKLGKEQAKIVASKLIDDNVEIVVSSPLKRAFETAQVIASELGIRSVIKEELLKERDFGVLTGKSLDDIPKFAKEILQVDKVSYFIEVDGAEDFPALYKRAQDFLQEISNRYPDSVVVAVTHGDIGKMIRAVYHGWTWEEGLKAPYFENTGVLHLEEKDILE